MFINIKKVLKRGICVLLVVTAVCLGAKYGRIRHLQAQKIKCDYDIAQFKSKGYTVSDARIARFNDESIIEAYDHDAIVTFYGDKGELKFETLKQIKEVLGNDVDKFNSKGYTVAEAKVVQFSDEEVFLGYDRNAIVEAYGDDGILNAETLCEIKTALGEYCKEYDMSEINIVRLFHSKGYTEEEARVAGFSNDEISRTYM